MFDGKPHIVMIVTDQQRFDTIRAWGYGHMITPHMDRLASESLSFRQAYCPGATCVASRAAIFTGMYPHTTGVYSFDHWGEHRNWVQDLSDHGYWCVNIGKMHLSPRDIPGGFQERVIVENPTNKTHANGGADDDWGRYMSFYGITRPNDRNQADPDWLKKCQGVVWHEEERFHSDVFIGDSAVSWINNYRGQKPIFLEVGLTGPHEPWDPLPRHLDMYRDKEMPPCVKREGELDEKPPQHLAHLDMHATTAHESQIDLRGRTDEEIEHMKRHYFAKITTVDEQVGRVMNALESRGWLENSMVIFCSDHGEMLGDHGLAYKWLMYDSIVHIPLMIRYPKSVQKPGETTDLVSLMDLGPTILEAAGIDVPTYLEGRSLMPYLKGENVNPREFVFCEDNYQIMMRSQTHKLVYYIGQEEGELYDLDADAGELWNLWNKPEAFEVKSGMLMRLLSWMATSNYYNAGYKRQRSRHYGMRWPTEGDAYLHGGKGKQQPRLVDL
jgi:arylsulfatase